MKKMIFIALLMCSTFISSAQTLSPKVIPTAGGYVSGGGVTLSFTMGETLTPTLTAGGHMLSQGQQQPEINLLTNSVLGELCAGGMITVGFAASSYMAVANVFTLQLSDGTGSFAVPVNLATVSGAMSGAITGVIPPSTVLGPGYRVRVVSSQPFFVGSELPVPVCTCVAPTVTCPNNLTVNAALNQCSSIANWMVPTPAGNCQPTVSGTATPNVTQFPVGVSIVTYAATNGRDVQSGTCSFSVTVLDDQNPSIVCPGNISRNTDANQCSAIVTYSIPSFSDNCGGASLTRTSGLASGSAFPKGANMVEWKATDAAGRSAICQFTVTVSDGESPGLACPADITRSADAGLCSAAVTYATPTYSDNCAGGGIALVPPSLSSGSTFPAGTSSVVWEATDATGLTKRCTFTVTVNDTQQPNISCPANQTVGNTPGSCSAAVNYPIPTYSDNCVGGGAALQSGLPSGGIFPKGQTTVVWRATDAVGLTKTCSFRITVNDTENPVIACPSSQSKTADAGLCTALTTYSTPTVTDNCAPAPPVVRVSGPASGSTFSVGTTTCVWRSTDGASRSSTCSFTVTVTDNQAPGISCPANQSVTAAPGQCSATFYYSNPTATDNCGVISVYLLSGLASGSLFPQGETVNTWRAVDVNGLSQTCSFSVTVSCGAGAQGGGAASRNLTPSQKSSQPSHLDLQLSPNPAVVEIQISIEGLAEAGGELTVLDAQGRLMRRQWVDRGSLSYPLTLTLLDFAAGVYSATLCSKGEKVTKWFVVSRL